MTIRRDPKFQAELQRVLKAAKLEHMLPYNEDQDLEMFQAIAVERHLIASIRESAARSEAEGRPTHGSCCPCDACMDRDRAEG
jgi:hypothetical protein